jgi:hypothetical protein
VILFTTRQILGGKLEIQIKELGVDGFLADILAECVCVKQKQEILLYTLIICCEKTVRPVDAIPVFAS